MNRNFFIAAGVTLVFAATAAAQDIPVVGTGDPSVDVPAVQAAVDQGRQVLLKGHFSFDAPPTAAEPPDGLLGTAAFGMIRISKTVAISGALDDQGQMTAVEAGTNPFYVGALGAHVSIKGLHFLHSKGVAIRVAAVSALVISSNRIEGVASTGNNVAGILIGTTPGPPTADQLAESGNISGTLLIANNDIDLQAQAGHNYLGILVFAAGKSPDREVELYISGNQIKNSNERPINVYSIGGRAYIERNVITTTGGAGVSHAFGRCDPHCRARLIPDRAQHHRLPMDVGPTGGHPPYDSSVRARFARHYHRQRREHVRSRGHAVRLNQRGD
jgi:hypothetical protein